MTTGVEYLVAEVWLNNREDRWTPVGDGTRPHSYGRSGNISFGEFSGEVRGKGAACSPGVTNGLRKGFVTLGNWLQSLV